MKALLLMFTLAACAGGIQQDKVGHFIAGAGVAIVARELGATQFEACVYSLGVGLAKEAYDSKFGGTVEAMDAIATGLGCSVAIAF